MSIGSHQDFIVHNVPALLSRQVTRPAGDDVSKWVKDESWCDSVRETFFHLFSFFQAHELLREKIVETPADVDTVVLRLSDFTDEGQRLVMSQAPHKWLASFDRPGSKKRRSDVSYLERQLEKQRSMPP